MSDDWYTDIDPPESGLRSKDLYNRVCLIRPIAAGSDVGKEDGEAYSFWTCNVVILNAGGIETFDPDVRLAWKNVQRGLANRKGKWILAKAVQDDKAWILDPNAVDQKIRQIVAGLKDEVEALFAPAAVQPAAPPAYEDGSEPF